MMWRKWMGWMLCTLGSQQLQAMDCEQAQRTILSLSEANQAQLVVENIHYDEQNAFVDSKPQIKGPRVIIGTFATAAQGYEQLWCKLKSQDAVLAANQWKSEAPPQDCAVLNRLQGEQALASLGLDAGPGSLEALGIQFTKDKDFITGLQWAPASVAITKSGSTVKVQAMRLKTPTWLPVIGGMNYCKILSPTGAVQLIQEQKAKSFASSPQKIEWTGGLNSKQSALVWLHGDLDEALQTAKGTVLISPGAEIPPEAMSGLADRLTDLGYLTLVIQYPNNSAILDSISGHGNSAINLGQKIKNAPQDIKGLAAAALQSKPLYVIGHSLGGATLADEVYRNAQASVFDHIFLYGTASFVKIGSKVPTSSPVTLLFGENDGLSRKDIPGILKSFEIPYDPTVFTAVASTVYPKISTQRLQGLNHFCIVSDQTVGNATLKKQDGMGLEPEACLQVLVQALGL